MKYKEAVTLLCLIAVGQCYLAGSHNVQSGRNFLRTKRTVQAQLGVIPLVAAQPHPCDPYVPPRRPDFAAGRRISEAKCLEYIWDITIRDDNVTHYDKCLKRREETLGQHRLAISGRNNEPGPIPHVGALGWRAVEGNWFFLCESTLISSKFVVTVAHCSRLRRVDTTISDPRPQIVRFGDSIFKDPIPSDFKPVDVNISRIILHPQYTSVMKYFDIALMELAERVTFTKTLQPACLWGHLDIHNLGLKANVTGLSFTKKSRSKPEFLVAEVNFMDQNECDTILKPKRASYFTGLQPHQLCASKLVRGVDICQGDFGGPIQVKISSPVTSQVSLHYLVGVTSFGIGCGSDTSPGVYTRIASFIDWIEDTVWSEEQLVSVSRV